MFHFRSWLLGGLTPLALCAAGLSLRPDRWWALPPSHPLSVLDNIAPHMAGVTLALAGLFALLRARRAALCLVLVAAVGLIDLMVQQRRLTAPTPAALAQGPGTAILWLNLYKKNTRPAAEVIAALARAEADIILLSEPGLLRDQTEALRRHFPYVSDCPQPCGILLLARQAPDELTRRRMPRTRPNRLLRAEFPLPGGQVLTVIGSQMIKPWYDGFSQLDEWYLTDEIDKAPGPLLVIGDFNSTPWSSRVRRLSAGCDLRLPPGRPATWPAMLGGLGLPIDGALLRGLGAAPVQPWGAGLGSNHRGLLITVHPDPPAPARKPCAPGFS